MVKYLLYSYMMLIGIIVIFGLFIGLCNKLFYRSFGRYGRKLCVLTGLIGTPIHESGHAFFCLIFGHKIQEINFYSPKSDTLGYVSHSYRPKNIYHQIGNFFIAVGPIIFGTLVELGLMFLLVKGSFLDFYKNDFKPLISSDALSTKSFFTISWDFLKCMFNFENFKDYKWWIFIMLSLFIALHLNLSKEDIKGGSLSFGLISVLIILINSILYLALKPNLERAYHFYTKFGCITYSLLLLSAILSIVLLFIAFISMAIKRLFKHRNKEN